MLFLPKIILFLSVLFFSACTQAQEDENVASEKENFKVTVIAEDLNHPWSLAFLPNGDYLVSERGGTLWRISEEGQKI